MSKVGAYGTPANKNDTSFRKEWNEEEYAEKARAKDQEQYERAKEAEEYAKQGKRPPRKKEDIPKPTKMMEAREAPLDLAKNKNKTIIINAGAGGAAGQPGFYCDVCRRTCKDSQGYMDHINGRSHLRRLGQTTKVIKSTLNDVRTKIAELRLKTSESAKSKQYDFEARIKEIKDMEVASRLEKKEEKKRKKVEALKVKNGGGEEEVQMDEEMMKLMGFGKFGGS